MGAGASTKKGGAAAEPVSGAEALAKAESSKKEGKKLFKAIDSNNDKKITIKEIQNAIKKHGSDIEAKWPAATIEKTVTFFDRDNDGKLSEDEFLECLAELKKREEIACTPKAAKAENPVEKEAKEKYAKYKDASDGAFVLKHMAKLVREINEEEGIWDDNAFGPLVKSELAKASGSDDKKTQVTEEMFVAWYPSFKKQVDDLLAQREAEAKAKKAAIAAASAPKFEGDTWECPLDKLLEAYAECDKQKKTPLLIDMTDPEKQSSFSPLETFFGYDGGFVELKKMVVQVNMKKEKTLEEAQKEVAKEILRSMKQGMRFKFLLANSAPPFMSKFSHETYMPKELLDAEKVLGCVGADNKIEGGPFEKLAQYGADNFGGEPSIFNSPALPVHNDFSTCVVTKFSPEDYAEFLADEWPLDKMQPIKVFTKS